MFALNQKAFDRRAYTKHCIFFSENTDQEAKYQSCVTHHFFALYNFVRNHISSLIAASEPNLTPALAQLFDRMKK